MKSRDASLSARMIPGTTADVRKGIGCERRPVRSARHGLIRSPHEEKERLSVLFGRNGTSLPSHIVLIKTTSGTSFATLRAHKVAKSIFPGESEDRHFPFPAG